MLSINILAWMYAWQQHVNPGRNLSPDNALHTRKQTLPRHQLRHDALKQLEKPGHHPGQQQRLLHRGQPDEFTRNRARPDPAHTQHIHTEQLYERQVCIPGYAFNVEPLEPGRYRHPADQMNSTGRLFPVMSPGEKWVYTYWKVSVPLRYTSRPQDKYRDHEREHHDTEPDNSEYTPCSRT